MHDLRRDVLRLCASPFPAELERLGLPTHPGAEQILAAVEGRDWGQALGWASSFWRFGLFILLAPRMTPDERREQLAEIWSVCDGCIWPWRGEALAYLRQVGYIGDLPRPAAPLTLYRGVHTSAHRLGLSWSLSVDKARWFVRRGGRGHNMGGFVYRAIAPPDAILAGFNDRGEEEYVVDPTRLRAVRRVEVVSPEIPESPRDPRGCQIGCQTGSVRAQEDNKSAKSYLKSGAPGWRNWQTRRT